VFLWGKGGDLTVRWPSRAMREEPGRRHSELHLTPWSTFIREQADKLSKEAKA
jgi:hypothetical protein